MKYKVRCRWEKCKKLFYFPPENGEQVMYRGSRVLTKIFKKEDEDEDTEEIYVATCPHCKTAKKIRIKKGDNHEREY